MPCRLNGTCSGSSLQLRSQKIYILDWWEGMSETLPLLYAVARRALAVPATSCDVERCFSSLKWVRDERQRRMKCETHRAAVMLHYNGSLQ